MAMIHTTYRLFSAPLLIFGISLLAFLSPSDCAQAGQVGVVWTPEGTQADQVRTVRVLHDQGIRHVRATQWPASQALQAAEAMQVALYVDIDLGGADHSLSDTERLSHPAVAGVGWSGSLTAAGCGRWNAIESQLSEDMMRYVVAPVSPQGAACSFASDTVVLTDVRMLEQPFARVDEWEQAHSGRVGVAALGIPRSDQAASGWQVPRSAEAQARYLERMLETAYARGIPLTFASGWTPSSDRGPARFHLTTGRTLMPAGDVVAAATQESFRPFAFAPGTTTPSYDSGLGWLSIMVWLVFAIAAGALIYLPSVQRIMTRYLFAYGFYHEAMREGRDATPAAVGMMGGCILGALWMGSAVILGEVIWLRPTVLALEALPLSVQSTIETALHTPVKTASIGVGMLAGGFVIWAGAVVIASHWTTTPLSWMQAMVLGIVPWWGGLLWMLLAVVGPAIHPSLSVLLLLGGALVAAGWIALRATYDLYRTTKAPLWLAGSTLLLTPGGVLVFLLFVGWYGYAIDGAWIMKLLWYG